jgi:copper(I)-binding protein
MRSASPGEHSSSPGASPRTPWPGTPRRPAAPFLRRGALTALARRGAVAAAVLACLGAAAGCAARAGASPSIEVATAYVPVPHAHGTTVAYVVIRNNGSADRLMAAHTSAGGRVTFREAHGPGASVMSTVPSVRIPGHGTLAMRPDGIHMLITGAGPMRGGKDITLTLVFAHAGRVSVVAQVTNPQSGGSSYFLN